VVAVHSSEIITKHDVTSQNTTSFIHHSKDFKSQILFCLLILIQNYYEYFNFLHILVSAY
jgi:hypothetical protein